MSLFRLRAAVALAFGTRESQYRRQHTAAREHPPDLHLHLKCHHPHDSSDAPCQLLQPSAAASLLRHHAAKGKVLKSLLSR